MKYKLVAVLVSVWQISLVFADKQCSNFKNEERFDCFPGPSSSQTECINRGCCWVPTGNDITVDVPYCYYPSNFPTYNTDQLNKTSRGYTGFLSRSGSQKDADLSKLKLDVIFETNTRLRFRITDPNAKRWEVPIPLDPADQQPPSSPAYNISVNKTPFGIKVTRKQDGMVMFDTITPKVPLRYSNQFLQISTKLTVTKGYGQGEQRAPLVHDLTKWMIKAFWARDQPPSPGVNLYGLHNFFLGMPDDGSAFGIFFLNSNAQEVAYQPLPAITYRTIGGVLDFFIFTGPNPASVVQQYYRLIGHPMLPPYWSLGFHLSKYGVENLNDLKKIYTRNINAHIPLDTQWSDIDYMDAYFDWTYDKKNYAGLPDYVKYLHANDTHYVVIIDPGISNEKPGQYPPYDDGLKEGVFIMKSDGSGPIVGKVWPGNTVFPDFTNPITFSWWYKLAQNFYNQVNFDGLWIDMNEPSNFVKGSLDGCTAGSLDNPPFVPSIGGGSLQDKTICPSGKQYLSTHYNLHTMYGYYEANVTNRAIKQILPKKRVFLLSRSTFAGSGRYTFHWTGDNSADWTAMYYSIPQILNFNMFGIPFVGADICGFMGSTTEELCTRWMQLGAFYPFMRNHNNKGSNDQDPAAWSPTAQNAMRYVLQMRIAMLPYMYTLLHKASQNGTTVARPLAFEFPNDPATHSIDKQFMLGSAIMISPALTNGARSVQAYIPDAVWCNAYSGAQIKQRKTTVTLPAPLDLINVHIRGGSLIPTLPPAQNTKQSRKGPFGLTGCLGPNGNAVGELYWDDGETTSAQTLDQFNIIQFRATSGKLLSIPMHVGYKTEAMTLNRIGLVGVAKRPASVTINGVATPKFSYNSTVQFLVVELSADLMKPITVTWK